MEVSAVKCPQCGSEELYKDGLRYLGDVRTLQRWLCRRCAYRFSEPNVKLNVTLQIGERPESSNDLPHNIVSKFDLSPKKSIDSLSFLPSENIASHGRSSVGQRLNSLRDYNRTHQVCASEQRAKNLDAATETKTVADDSSKGNVLDFAWKLKKRGLAESTIKHRTYWLNVLKKKGADLNDTDSVETVLATENFKSGSKADLVRSYRSYTQTYGISWTPVRVKHTQKQPFIPLESEIDALIAGCGKRTSTFLQTLKDTGARAG
ncbi:hypothetical protein MUP77_00885, partial [Candidatus Bathyarchaeota archaeon]|nr:hypothetical protein [Candidatus Bathyarchaeota archaeon]